MTTTQERRLEALPRAEALQLLRSVSVGRLVFTHLALTAIRPVDGDRIIIRSYLGTAIAAAVGGNSGMVVAYEADHIDGESHLGWSVIITGRACRLSDDVEIERYQGLLQPWVAGGMDDVIAIEADLVDGFRLVRA
jgi:hypothetical protein